jgi:hypothetical protein
LPKALKLGDDNPAIEMEVNQLQTEVCRLAKLQNDLLLSNEALNTILGYKEGINHPIKGDKVQEFQKLLHEQLAKEIPVIPISATINFNEVRGAIVDVPKLLRLIAEHHPTIKLPANGQARLLISADGRNSSKSSQFTLVTMTILPNPDCKAEIENYASIDRVFTIGLMEIGESYECMKVLLRELRPYLELVKEGLRNVVSKHIEPHKPKRKSRAKCKNPKKGVCTCSANHHVKPTSAYYLRFQLFWCSDWKMLATVLGLNAANADYFCPFCTWLAQVRTSSKPEEFEKYLRSFEKLSGECCLLCDNTCEIFARTPNAEVFINQNLSKRTCKPNHGIIQPMLLPLSVFDSIESIWIDVLHCLLRLTDVQERALIQATTWKEEPLQALITAVKAQCSVNWIPYEKYDKTTGVSSIKFPTLDGKVHNLFL